MAAMPHCSMTNEFSPSILMSITDHLLRWLCSSNLVKLMVRIEDRGSDAENTNYKDVQQTTPEMTGVVYESKVSPQILYNFSSQRILNKSVYFQLLGSLNNKTKAFISTTLASLNNKTKAFISNF